MENSPTTAMAWWCARDARFPDGYMLWLPSIFFLIDDSPDLASAMIWTLTVLLTAAAFWAAGRGRAESWVETLFAFGWIGAWSLASGVLLAGGRAWPWAALCLAAGVAALALAWACRRRRPLEHIPTERGAAAGRDATIWLAVSTVLLLLLGREALPWAAAAIFAPAFLCHLLLASRGRAARPGEAGR